MSLCNRIPQAIKEFKEESLNVINIYGGKKIFIIFDMMWCLCRYGARPIDYTRFEFYKKSPKERDRYLTIFRYFKLAEKISHQLPDAITGNKVAEYTYFKNFIKRDWILINSNTPVETIMNFIAKYECIIAKPNNGEQGKGVMKIHLSDKERIDSLLHDRLKRNYILEELLVNNSSIAQINPSSLNTIRCYTFIDKSQNIHILEIMLRVGIAGSDVDNWGAGGIGYVFDKETGICSQYGLDKLNRPYTYHPGSNIQMIGYKLPYFKELKEYIYELCSVNKSARYVGWDIAITPKGFDLVEMNCPGGHDFLQAFGTPWGDFIKKNW